MEFHADPFAIFDKDWALLTAGDKNKFNAMTIAWGGLGTLWGRPVVTVYVKPIRYTHSFMEESEYFTVSFYPEPCKKALGIMGAVSGRDCDKVKEAALTPKFLEHAVTFKEAKCTLLCKKIYRQDLDIGQVPAFARERYYASEKVHTMYIGEVIDILD